MPPVLALLLTIGFVGYLIRRESREEPRVSAAVWIPTIWLMIIGSRAISLWLDPSSGYSAERLEEGSLIDKAVYSALIVAGMLVLVTRRVQVGEILRNNIWIVLFILYEGLSVVWSDFPLVAFKRWGKALGDPVMVLVLCTDPAPRRAITAAIRRSAYVLIAFSVVLCKYFENLGRSFDQWGGASYTGVTTNKNMLGYLLFAYGLFFIAALVSGPREESGARDSERFSQLVNFMYLGMIGWLMVVADCKTALLALSAGTAVLIASRLAIVRRHFGLCATAAILLGLVLEMAFSISANLVEGAGRDTTFTGRTGLWQTLLEEPINPLIGVGYASFWLGDRLARLWAMYPASPPTEAHNGFLEVYLSLGLIGLFLVLGMVWSGLKRMRKRLALSLQMPETLHDRILSTFGIAYGISYLLYNVTEATFQGLNFLFVIFLVLTFDYPRTQERAHAVPEAIPATKWRRPVQGRIGVPAAAVRSGRR